MIREEVFDEGHVPRDIGHRNSEIAALESALAPIIEGRPPTNVIAVGPTGAGKTVTARYGLQQLAEQIDIRWARINCWRDSRRVPFFRALFEGLGIPPAVEPRHATDALLARLRDAVDDGGPIVLVLDEADRLAEPALLHDLSQIVDALVLIANDEDEIFASVPDRHDSSIRSGLRIYYDPYPVEALVDILDARVDAGLVDLFVPTAVLEEIADQAAGDARVAIQTLYWTARAAEKAGEVRLSTEMVDEAVPVATERIRQKTLDRLDDTDQLLYDIVDEHGEISSSQLHASYQTRADDPVSRRQRRSHLAKLEEYNLIEQLGETSSTRYQLVCPPETPDLQ